MILSGCRIVCLGGRGLQDSVRYMATQLGADTRDVVDYSCTHLLGVDMNNDAITFTNSFYPWIRVVHVRWIARCWTRGVRASEKDYDLPFYLQAKQTGTYTTLGCKNIFFAELTLFNFVNANIGGNKLASLLHDRLNARSYSSWIYVCRMLKDTLFWGHLVRNLNWQARRSVMLGLARYSVSKAPKPRKRPRCSSDGPAHVLLRVARLPCDLLRNIIEYL